MANVIIPEGFYAVDDEELVFVNNEGTVYNSVSGKYSNAHSFTTVALHSYQINNVAKSFHLARAIAWNFVPIPEDLSGVHISNLVVKHKDGNIRNVNASNLYWTVKNCAKPLKVILACGKEIIYKSIKHAWLKHGDATYASFASAVRKGYLEKKQIRFEKIEA